MDDWPPLACLLTLESVSKINLQELLKVKEMVENFCSRCFNIQVAPGITPDLPCVRLNLGEVSFVHRPLLYYVSIFAVQQTCGLVVTGGGF